MQRAVIGTKSECRCEWAQKDDKGTEGGERKARHPASHSLLCGKGCKHVLAHPTASRRDRAGLADEKWWYQGFRALGDRVRSSVAGNDLPLVTIHAHDGAQASRLAAKLKEWAAFADRTMPSPALRDRGQTHAADPSERLAQAAVGILHQQGTAENARPQLPFGDHVSTVGCDEHGNG